jgi:two-component system response regulator MprA
MLHRVRWFMPAPPHPRILLVEDDPAMVELIRVGLYYAGYEVLIATSGPEGLRMAQEAAPDLIVLDWMLPGLDGLSLCSRLRQASAAPILMLTARDALADRVRGLEAGADDYLVKPFHFEELLARIRARLRRREADTRSLVFADLRLDLDLHEAERNGRRITLTATELRLLSFLLRHPRQVLTKETILAAVWGYDFGGDANIVEQYVRALRQKLGPPPLIQTVRLVGYVLREKL